MEPAFYAVGQAVFIRTDTADYAEESVPFQNLEEMVKLCSVPRPGRVLDKVIVHSLSEEKACALTLGFVAATKGEKEETVRQPAERGKKRAGG